MGSCHRQVQTRKEGRRQTIWRSPRNDEEYGSVKCIAAVHSDTILSFRIAHDIFRTICIEGRKITFHRMTRFTGDEGMGDNKAMNSSRLENNWVQRILMEIRKNTNDNEDLLCSYYVHDLLWDHIMSENNAKYKCIDRFRILNTKWLIPLFWIKTWKHEIRHLQFRPK